MNDTGTKIFHRTQGVSMVKVLVADDDLDVHEVIRDILEINFKDVTIDRALTCESLISKVLHTKAEYDLVLVSLRLDEQCGGSLLPRIKNQNPGLAGRIVLLCDSSEDEEKVAADSLPCVSRPYSLDYFGEILRKACAS
jgi:CheY-like chemotaxis protein